MITSGSSHRPLRTRLLCLASVVGVLAASALATSGPAQADGTTPLLVVGTSDVSDSNLMSAVIEPQFEKAYPQFDLRYVGTGTSKAIGQAEAGAADALIVHAPSLENTFVDQGYSTENYGRAIFWGDYVLVGPKDDPAGVMTSDAHDIAGAFEKIAAAGALGKATFISREDGSGTNTQEHQIWGLTTGVKTCTATSGGGAIPSNTTGPCPTNPDSPSWYAPGATTQGANVQATDVCQNHTGCYTLTDRGTYQYLRSETPAGVSDNLVVETRNNDATAPGGIPALVNSFHAYAINPQKADPSGTRTFNTVGAKDLLDWLTSPTGQSDIGAYLANDPNGPAFMPDAAPQITVTAPPATVTPGQAVTIRGHLENAVPGTPALAGKTVTVTSALDVSPTPGLTAFGTTTTNALGDFSITYHATQNRIFGVTAPPTSQIENASLTPVFGDLLQRGDKLIGSVHVAGQITNFGASAAKPGTLAVSGRIAPAPADSLGRVFLTVRKQGSTGAFAYVGSAKPAAGATSFSFSTPLAKGPIEYRVVYQDAQNFDPVVTRIYSTTIR